MRRFRDGRRARRYWGTRARDATLPGFPVTKSLPACSSAIHGFRLPRNRLPPPRSSLRSSRPEVHCCLGSCRGRSRRSSTSWPFPSKRLFICHQQGWNLILNCPEINATFYRPPPPTPCPRPSPLLQPTRVNSSDSQPSTSLVCLRSQIWCCSRNLLSLSSSRQSRCFMREVVNIKRK